MTDLERIDKQIAAFDAAVARIMGERGITDPGLLTEADIREARREGEG